MKNSFNDEFLDYLMELIPIIEKDSYIYSKDFIKTIKAYKKLSEQFYKIIDITDKYQADVIGISNELRKSKEELRIAKDLAEKASNTKSEFLANISHEVRTPLNSIVGYTDLLINSNLESEQEKFAENIKTSAHSLLKLINDILDFSKIESDMFELEYLETDIISLTEEVIDIVKYSSAVKNLELILDLSNEMPGKFITDPYRLKQVLLNLINNAIKFTEKGEISISINFKATSRESGDLEIHIKDTGIGISQSAKEKLFKSFSQGDSSITRKYGGSGLGLVISDMIVKKMNSKIQFISTENQGSDFYFTLSSSYSNIYQPFNHKANKILIVESNLSLSNTLENYFRTNTQIIDQADNAIKAIRFIENDPLYDFIFIDYDLPNVNGLNLYKILERNTNLKIDLNKIIIMFDPIKNPFSYKEIIKHNLKNYITKPLKISDLQKVFNQIKLISATTNTNNNEVITVTSKLSVLVVEDNLLNMDLIYELLKRYVPNARIFQAYNGEEALCIINQHPLNIIFSDIQMPVMDGFKLVSNIKNKESSLNKNTKIIALTAMNYSDDFEKCKNAGFDDYLSKPIDYKELINIINKYSS